MNMPLTKILHVDPNNHAMPFSIALCLLPDVRKYLVGQSTFQYRSSMLLGWCHSKIIVAISMSRGLYALYYLRYETSVSNNDSCKEAHIIRLIPVFRSN